MCAFQVFPSWFHRRGLTCLCCQRYSIALRCYLLDACMLMFLQVPYWLLSTPGLHRRVLCIVCRHHLLAACVLTCLPGTITRYQARVSQACDVCCLLLVTDVYFRYPIGGCESRVLRLLVNEAAILNSRDKVSRWNFAQSGRATIHKCASIAFYHSNCEAIGCCQYTMCVLTTP